MVGLNHQIKPTIMVLFMGILKCVEGNMASIGDNSVSIPIGQSGDDVSGTQTRGHRKC